MKEIKKEADNTDFYDGMAVMGFNMLIKGAFLCYLSGRVSQALADPKEFLEKITPVVYEALMEFEQSFVIEPDGDHQVLKGSAGIKEMLDICRAYLNAKDE